MKASALVQKVRETLLDHRMIDPGDLVLVAVSGGADSTALLHILHSLSEGFRCRLHVAHFNHELRGVESLGDAEFVAGIAGSLGLAMEAGSAGDRLKRRSGDLSPEDAARRARYGFLEAAACRLGAQKIATAHTMDDQAETVLMRLIQGAGPGGLAGIRPVRDGIIIRPFIRCRARDIRDYLRDLGLTARVDSSNADGSFLRNRIRSQLLPILEQDFNPRIVESLAHISSVEQDVDRHLRASAHEALEHCAEWSEGKMRLALDRFENYDVALQAYMLRAVIREIQGHLTDVSFGHVQSLLDLTRRRATPFRQVSLPGSLVAYLDEGALVLAREEPLPEERPRKIEVPGSTRLADFGLEIRTSFVPPGDAERGGANHALFDWDSVRPPLQVRTWSPGDRFRPTGMRGRKKIQDFFVDEKIPRWIRHRTPLLVDRSAIHWVIGHRTSETSRVRDGTTRILRVEAIPLTA